ncbi:sialate O-acetylesterase [Stenotrophomonas maltophilia]|uniref:sialate O-acetylesterase n=1 Tax=Stenotrophomonas maltophilia TaxID=40324 RepID=UPI0013DAEF3E|nr:sialate O-acetylesterase [Stenotrophomonas maltophilia]
MSTEISTGADLNSMAFAEHVAGGAAGGVTYVVKGGRDLRAEVGSPTGIASGADVEALKAAQSSNAIGESTWTRLISVEPGLSQAIGAQADISPDTDAGSHVDPIKPGAQVVPNAGRFVRRTAAADGWEWLSANVLVMKADKAVVEAEKKLNEGRFSQMHGMVEVEVGTEIPLVLDNTGKGIAGIETSDLTLTGVTATPNPAATAALFRADDLGAVEVEAESKIPFLLDSRKRGVCGFDLATGRFWPDQGGDLVAAASRYTDTPLPADYKVLSLSVRLHIQQYGQSLAIGAAGMQFSTNAFYTQALTFGQGVRSTKPGSTANLPGTDSRKLLVEDNLSNQAEGETTNGESGLMATAHEVIERFYDAGNTPPLLFASTAGKGGYSLAELSFSSWWSQVLRDQLDESRARATEASEGWDVPAVLWMQGEADGAAATDPAAAAAYRAAMMQLIADTDAYANVGHSIPWLSYQTPRAIARVQFEMQRDIPGLYHATAIYDLKPSDGTHLTGASYHKMGRRFGRALHQLLLGFEPRRIWPRGAVRRGATIRWSFDVPQPPLRVAIDFPATENSGIALSVNGIRATSDSYTWTIEGSDIVFDVSGLALVDSDVIEVRYALDYRAPSSDWGTNVRTGNIVDSTPDTYWYSGVEYPLPYVMPHCYSPVINLKTGAASQ